MTDRTTPAPLDLDALRKIAEAATPGPWVGFFDGVPYVKTARGHIPALEVDTHSNAAHIAAFDPPTVLRLIELADMAEDFAGHIAAYHEGEAYFHRQAVMERENKLTAERDAVSVGRDTALQELANQSRRLGACESLCDAFRADLASARRILVQAGEALRPQERSSKSIRTLLAAIARATQTDTTDTETGI